MTNRIYLTYEQNKEKITLSIPASFEKLSHREKLNFINESACLINQKFIELMEVWAGKPRKK